MPIRGNMGGLGFLRPLARDGRLLLATLLPSTFLPLSSPQPCQAGRAGSRPSGMSQPPPHNPMPAGVRPHSPAVTTPGGSAAPTRPGETDPAYNDVVLSFLRKRGYQKAEEALRQDIEAAKQKAAAAAAGNASGSGASGPTAGTAGAGPGAGANAAGGGSTTAVGAAGAQGAASGVPSPAAGGSGGGTAGAKPAASGPQAAAHGSHTVPLSQLVQRNAPRLSKQQAAIAGNSPIYDLLLQQLPSTALHGLGLADVAREKERREREEKIAGAVAAGPAGVKKDNVADVEIKLLDPQERVLGYEGIREWVESGLEAWKVRLVRAMSMARVAQPAAADPVDAFNPSGRASAAALPRLRPNFPHAPLDILSTSRAVLLRRPRAGSPRDARRDAFDARRTHVSRPHRRESDRAPVQGGEVCRPHE